MTATAKTLRWVSALSMSIAFATAAFPVVSGQQRGRGGPPPPPQSAQQAAPVDLTGYWVSVVTEDWRWRMATPPKKDYQSLPLNQAARQAADAWDLEKDNAAGLQCKPYGAGNIMRQPGRLHITWQDENTLKVETDAGTQTRQFHFGNWKPQDARATWQGNSIAVWEPGRAARGAVPRSGSLKVVTTHLRPGYLRKNGVPYSANAVLTEYWDLTTERNRDQWITITSSVDDPQYLRRPWVTALQFRKEPDGAKWDPTPCSAR